MIPIEVEKDESGDSGPSPAEEVKGHERDDQEDQEKPGLSLAELSGGESSPLLAEAKGQHSDDEHEEKPEITSNPDTQAQSTSPADISTMKMALLSGDPSKVTDLIRSMEEDEKLEALSATYGGTGERGWDADEDHLFSWTSPILHAAQIGNIDIFNSVVDEIQKLNLSTDQKHAILTNVDTNGQSLLALAGRSGKKDIVQRVIRVIREFELPEEKLKRMRTEKNREGCSVLAMSARSGSVDVVQEVARILLPNEVAVAVAHVHIIARRLRANKSALGWLACALFLANRGYQLQDQLQEKDWVGRSVLAMAVRSGSKGVVEEVLQHVSKEKVQGMLAAKDINDHSLLTMAAQSGSREVVEHVLRVFQREELSKYKIQGMLRSVDIFGAPVLDHAVISGNGDTFKTVLRIVTNKLTKQEVREMLAYKDRTGGSSLTRAVSTGDVELFKAVLYAAKNGLSCEEVEEMLAYKDRTGGSLLTRAASTGNSEVFEAVLLDAVHNGLSHEEVKLKLSRQDMLGRSLLESAVDSKEAKKFRAAMTSVANFFHEEKVKELLGANDDTGSFLARAVSTGKKDMFGAVLEEVKNKLSDNHQVKTIMLLKDKDNQSLIASAVGSKSVEIIDVTIGAISDGPSKLTEEEVKDVISSRDKGGRSLLFMAVRSGSVEMFRKVFAVVSKNLSPKEMEEYLMDEDKTKRKRKCSLLSEAAISGNKGLFETVLSTLKDEPSADQVKNIISLKEVEGHSLLLLAVKSKSETMFKAALNFVSSVGGDDEVKKQLKAGRGGLTGSLLANAALSGRKGLFEAVLNTVKAKLPQEEVKSMILGQDPSSRSILFWAVDSTNTEMFDVAMKAACDELKNDQEVNNMLRAKHTFGWSLLHSAARHSTREVDLFDEVLKMIKDNLSKEQVRQIIYSLDDLGRSSLASAAALSRNVEVFKKVLPLFSQDLLWQQRSDRLWTNSYSKPITPVGEAITYGDLGVCCIALREAETNLVDRKVQDALDASFMSWEYRYQLARKYKNAREMDHCKRVLSMIFKHSARPPKQFIQRIVSKVTYGDDGWQFFTERVLSELESARNPLIPGMNVSVALAEAAEGAPEGEQRILLSFQKEVDNYVLKVLEWLPQTVRGFKNGMSQCSVLFEPEGPTNNLRGRPGPLRVAFERRQQMKSLCAVPLIMDYIWLRFTRGLPTLRDSGNVLQDRAELMRLAKEGEDGGGLVLGVEPNDGFFSLDKHSSENQQDLHPLGNQLELHLAGDFKDSGFLRVWLQGANASRPNLTFLPGLQFIVAGILTKPNSYYEVPALRMALDFVIYIIMLGAYSEWVLLSEDGPLTTGEIAFAVYSLGATLRELREMIRDIDVYLRDRWNVLDVFSLVILGVGFFYRLADSGSPWGRALYALSTPFVFSRLLFYAQFLPFQGSMVEVIFGMAKVILQFGVVLIVVMTGFAMSLFPLLKHDDDFTFNETLLLLFKTLLGDVDAFDEFDEGDGNRYAFMGRLLLVLYLVIMTIMLLNLLIAVLSTAHVKVEMNADKGLEVSKVRIVQHYRRVVALDILPAPLNLVQFIPTFPFFFAGRWHCTACRRILHAVGCVLFWLVLSPLAVVVGITLWVASSVFSVFVSYREMIRSMPAFPILGSLYQRTLVFLFCAVGAPTCLLFLWIREPCLWIIATPTMNVLRFCACGGRNAQIHTTTRDENGDANEVDVEDDVYSMLEVAGVGASDIHKYLQDPMIDPRVRPDDVERGATVEHIKLLRDRLVTMFNEGVDRLAKQFNERVDLLKKDLGKQG